MNKLSPAVQRIVAVGLLVLGLAAVGAFVIAPIVSWALDSIEQRDDARFALARATAAARAGTHVNAGALAAARGSVAAALLPGATEAEAGASLQGVLSPLVRAEGIALEALQMNPAAASPPLTKISVELRANGREGEIEKLLAAIEQTPAWIRVERLTLRANGNTLALDATLAAWWAPGGTP